MFAKLQHPSISLQLRGDLNYDRLRRRLETRSFISYARQWAWEYIPGASNPQVDLQEDIRFLKSLQSVANGSDGRSIVDEITRVAADILHGRVEGSIKSFLRTLKPRLAMHAKIQLDSVVNENVRQKTLAAWKTLLTKLNEELDRDRLNSVPGTSYDTLQLLYVLHSLPLRTVLHLTNIWPGNTRAS